MNMLPDYRVNLVSFTFGVSQNIEAFRLQCAGFGLTLADISIGTKRNVMYIKFKIDKPAQVGTYNPNSTSNRRNFASVTFQVTQKGFIIIQGSAGQNESSFALIERVQALLREKLTPFIRKTPALPAKTPKPKTRVRKSTK